EQTSGLSRSARGSVKEPAAAGAKTYQESECPVQLSVADTSCANGSTLQRKRSPSAVTVASDGGSAESTATSRGSVKGGTGANGTVATEAWEGTAKDVAEKGPFLLPRETVSMRPNASNGGVIGTVGTAAGSLPGNG